MTVYYLILGFEALVVLLISFFLFRKIFSLYRDRRERKRNSY